MVELNPYIVRFVSVERNRGKTFVASNVVQRLKARGYIVAVVKHAHREIDLGDKDSYIYSLSGADIVVFL